MNYPSAVNVARLPQAYVPDTSRQSQQMAGLVSGIAQDYKQAANQKRANSLADQLLDGSIQENPKTEAEEQAQRQLKNSILQTEIVNAKEEQASMSLQAKAEQQRKVIRENTRLQQIMASPEDKKALVELMQLDKQLAGSVLDILKADDAHAKQAMAAASADALQTYSNYRVLMQQHGKPVADEFALAKAREIYAETQDPSSVRHLMAMRSASGDEAMAIANTQSALAGATLKAPAVQEQLTLYQQAQLRNKDEDQALAIRQQELAERKYEDERADASKPNQTATEAKAEAEKEKLERSWNAYVEGAKNLKEAFSKINTGAIMGRFPATGTDAQVAEGAVAAMAPILKRLTRTAGEGNFSDADQRLLLEQLPKRTDTEEAVEQKLTNITKILAQQLGFQAPPELGGVDVNQVLQEAEAAIAAGAPRELVEQRLRESGYIQ